MKRVIALSIFTPIILATLIFSLSCSKKDEKKDDREAVANLIEYKENVKVRYRKKLVWNDAEIKMGLANYDSVKTGESSFGKVKFTDQTELNIEERSLVIILEREEKAEKRRNIVALPSGRVEGSVPADAGKEVSLQVRTPTAWIEVKNRNKKGEVKKAKIKVNLNKSGTLKLKTVSGSAKVVTKRKQEVVDEGEARVIRKVAPPPEEIKEPETFVEEDFEEPPELEEEVKIEVFEGDVDIPEPEVEAIPSPTPTPTPSPSPSPTPKKKLPNRFSILSPLNKVVIRSSTTSIKMILQGDLEVFMNGKKLRARANGRLIQPVKLKLGLNLFTFQIVNKKTNKLTHQVLEIIRKP